MSYVLMTIAVAVCGLGWLTAAATGFASKDGDGRMVHLNAWLSSLLLISALSFAALAGAHW
jgi:hypothetical protein